MTAVRVPGLTWQSLRLRLPLLLLAYCAAVGLALYFIVAQVQERRLEAEFESRQVVRAVELQNRTERAAERGELDTGQREFGELAALEPLRAAVFVAPDGRVLLTSRRDWLNQPVDLAAFGLAPEDQERVRGAMTGARQSRVTQRLFTGNRQGLVLVLPAALPVVPGALQVDRSALIVLVYDLRLAKAINAHRLRQQFAWFAGALVVAVFGLGIGLHWFVTRRLDQLRGMMSRFATGDVVADRPSRMKDEIADIHAQFNDMADAVRREMTERRQAEALARSSELKFRSAMNYSPIGLGLVTPDGRMLDANPALCSILGYSLEELQGLTFRDITHPDDAPESLVLSQRMQSREIESFEVDKRYVHKAGHTVWVQLNASMVWSGDRPQYLVAQVQDVTGRRRADAELRRVNRALRTISECNQALVHATDEDSLLREVCRVVVNEGGFRMAWVGFVADGGGLRTDAVVAIQGHEDGYLGIVRDMVQPHGPEMNPTITALTTGRPVICRDYETDPSVAPWRHEALKRGYRSSVILPIVADGKSIGILTIYSGQTDAFDEHEMAMLEEMAADLSYGIQALRTRQRHAQAEKDLAASEKLLRQLIRHTPAAVAMFDREMRYIEVSDRWLSDYQLQGQSILGRSHYDVFLDAPAHWKAVHERVLAGSVERCDEEPFPRADGTIEWLAWDVRPWHQADGSIGGLTMFTQVITERKRAENELRESQSKLMLAMEMARLAPWECDIATGEFLFNDHVYALLRTTAEAEGGYRMPIAVYAERFLPEGEPVTMRAEIEAMMASGDSRYTRGTEHRFMRADGSTGTMQVRFGPLMDDSGKVIRMRGVNQDITESRQREEALRISEERFRSAMSHSPVGMAIVAPDGRFTEVNSALCAIVGYTREELVRTRFQALTHPDDLAADLAGVQQLLDRVVEAYQIEKRYLHKRGYVVWTQHNVSLVRDELNQPRYFVQQVQDITERKRAAAEMQALNERYARHEAALAMLTRSHVQSPSQFPEVLRAITEVVGRTLEVARVAVWRPNADATTFVLHDLYEWPNDNHSSGRAIVGPEVLDYSRTLAAGDIVVASDALRDERTAAFTAAHLTEFGVTSLIDVPIREQGAMTGVLCCGHVGPRRKWTPDEQTFAVAVANLLSSLFGQVGRQHLEEQLRQAQKLEGIGQLAGGVAHDFNNVLTVILGKAGQLSDDPRLPPALREATHDIIQSGERAANLTRQLLAFSRRQAMQVKDVDLNVVIRSVSRMLERVLGEDLTLQFSFATEPALVSADAGMIDQVILNLAINARDAMRRGGLLVVETALVEINEQTAGRAGQEPGPYACVRVTDTGTGIPPEHLPHIFEPFFTTKDIGKGTGLGLATTYGIVQQHGGWIDVETEVGRGTTFRVFLPRLSAARQSPPALAAPAPAALRAATGRETILVVEDEAEVRSLIVEALAGFGYQMLEAESGPQALGVWRQHGSPIDLLITDMVMPDGMNGLELASELSGLNPGLRIIYISGYLADVSQEDLLRSEGATYIAKPFSLPALARVVRTSLDATTERRQMQR